MPGELQKNTSPPLLLSLISLYLSFHVSALSLQLLWDPSTPGCNAKAANFNVAADVGVFILCRETDCIHLACVCISKSLFISPIWYANRHVHHFTVCTCSRQSVYFTGCFQRQPGSFAMLDIGELLDVLCCFFKQRDESVFVLFPCCTKMGGYLLTLSLENKRDVVSRCDSHFYLQKEWHTCNVFTQDLLK